MRKRRVLGLLLACVVIGVVGALVWPREREPEYAGKTLSGWLALYRSNYGAREERQEPAEAVRHIGTNALPWLLKRIQYDPPAWRYKLSAAAWKLPGPIRDSRLVRWLLEDKAARDASDGFEILGPQASPAIPELTRLMKDQKSLRKSGNAIHALGFLGEEALPPLLAALANPQQTNRVYVTFALSYLGSNAAPAVPALVQCLEDTNIWARLPAARTLGDLRLEPDLVVPALTNCLQTTNTVLRLVVMRSLGDFGSQAVCAVPSLQMALNDPDATVRSSASNALQKIAPEVLRADSPEPKVQSPKSEELEK